MFYVILLYMEQHQVPRQITTFEFKLIGFMTLRQFIYLIIFVPLAYIIFNIFPIPVVNLLLAILVGGFGVALAFVPVNEQPLDVFLKNLVKRLSSPTQYIYQKGDGTTSFSYTPIAVDTREKEAHADAQKKLSHYLSQTQHSPADKDEFIEKKQLISRMFQETTAAQAKDSGIEPSVSQADEEKKPFFTGIIRNRKNIPLPGILIYIKDHTDTPLRLLKTNPHGVFATFNPLPKGSYTIETKDPKGTFFFDTMKVEFGEGNPKPFELYSKELL